MTERRRNRVVAVTGASGAGKDYVMARAVADNSMRVENWGTWLGKAIKTHRDEMMERVEPEKVGATQFTAWRRLLQLCPLVVACHTVRMEQGKAALRPGSGVALRSRMLRIHLRSPGADREPGTRPQRDRRAAGAQAVGGENREGVQEQELLLLRELAGELRTRLVVVRNTPEEEKECISMVRHEIRTLMREA